MHKRKKCGVRVIVAILLFAPILFAALGYAAGEPVVTKRLALIYQGRVLVAYFEGRYREIKQTEGFFYGYGWLDDHRVFVAYQQEGTGEAVAELEVIDLRQSRTTKLTRIGGVGESHFDVNSSTGEVVYDNSSGVHLLRIDAKTNSYKIYVIKEIDILKKDVGCHGAFWVDSKTVGCFVFKNAKPDFVKFSVPPKLIERKQKAGTGFN